MPSAVEYYSFMHLSDTAHSDKLKSAVAEEKCDELDGKIHMLHFEDIKQYLRV